jgi:hypothetical protein
MKGALVNTNEMNIYDFARAEWQTVTYQGEVALPPVDSHSAVLDEAGRRLIIFGGFLNE